MEILTTLFFVAFGILFLFRLFGNVTNTKRDRINENDSHNNMNDEFIRQQNLFEQINSQNSLQVQRDIDNGMQQMNIEQHNLHQQLHDINSQNNLYNNLSDSTSMVDPGNLNGQDSTNY